MSRALTAYVLHHYDWSESSVILDLFTREQGRIAVAAKGAKRPFSQLRSVLLPFQRIAATIVVERDAHKGMIIGSGGERLKRIGSESRQELEHLLDARVFLELWVKVRSGWADDEAHLRSYGYE